MNPAKVPMTRPTPVDLDALLDESGNEVSKGHGIRSLGPSDSSDTGADMMGIGGLDNTSDRNGTGERASVETDPDVDAGIDLATDAVVGAEEAGLGGGLDQAEEAQLGITDEEIERALRNRTRPRRG
jgi:hypothetical protein